MVSASGAGKKITLILILALVFDENNESDGDIDLGDTEFVGEESNDDIIEYEVENIGEVNKVHAPTQLAYQQQPHQHHRLLHLIWFLILYQIFVK